MTFALNVVVRTTMLLVGAGVLCALLHRASAAVRHAVWASALLAVLVFPLVSIVLPSMEFAILPERPAASVAAPVAIPEAFAPIDATAVHAVETAARWTPVEWGIAVWALGFCAIAFQTIVAWRELHKLNRSSRFLSGDSWPELLARTQRELSVRKLVQIRASENPGPLTSGILTPVILLPAAADDWSPVRRRLVLAHEMAHVKRNDALLQLLCQVICSVYWFNPLVWYAIRQLRLERERACDDHVLALGGSAPDYADHLLEIARGLNSGFALAAVSMAQPSHLKSRVLAILDSKIRRTQMTKAAAVALVSVAAVLTITLATVRVTTLSATPLPAVLTPPAIASPVQLPAQEQSPGYVVNRTPLSYPPEALRKRIEGTVVVELSFSANGEIVDSHVLSGAPELRQSAIQTAIGGKYNISVERSLQVVVDFKLPAQVDFKTPGQGTAQLSGIVVNAERTPLPGARITAINTQAPYVVTSITDNTGTYRFPTLSAGTYRLYADFPGLRTQGFESVPIGNAMQVRMNFTLRPQDPPNQVQAPWPLPPFATPPNSTVTVTTRAPEVEKDPATNISVAAIGPRVRVGGTVMAARLTQQVKPTYPQEAKDARIQGVVVLEAEIGTDGHVTGLRVITGHPLLVPPAMEAVKNWVYEPVMIADQAANVVTTVTVNFSFQP